jgi:hypothetical protein
MCEHIHTVVFEYKNLQGELFTADSCLDCGKDFEWKHVTGTSEVASQTDLVDELHDDGRVGA